MTMSPCCTEMPISMYTIFHYGKLMIIGHFSEIWIIQMRLSLHVPDDTSVPVGGLEHFIVFPYIGNVIIPTDFHISQRGRLNHQPAIHFG